MDWTDSQTYWLNLMNAGLGAFTLLGLVFAAGLLSREVVRRWWPRRT